MVTFNSRSFKTLDILRGFAAFAVLLCHARLLLFPGIDKYLAVHPSLFAKVYAYALSITIIGRSAVITFFVLSGLSIAYSIKNNHDYASYLKKRFVRIYPTYLLGLIFCIFIYVLILHVPVINVDSAHIGFWIKKDLKDDFLGWKNILSTSFYLKSGSIDGQFWSLAYEVVFYFLAPVFVKNFKLYSFISVILFVGGILLRHYLPHNMLADDYASNNKFSDIIVPYLFYFNFYFFIGILIFRNIHVILNYWPAMPLYVFNLLFFVGVIVLVLSSKWSALHGNFYVADLVALGVALFITKFSLNLDIKNRFFKFVGDFSYSLYVFHMASIYLFYYILTLIYKQDSFIYHPFSWILGSVFAFFLSYLMYFVCERTCKTYLNKLRGKPFTAAS